MTTQQTSKGYKFIQSMGVLGIIAGILWIAVASASESSPAAGSGFLFVVVSFFAYVFGRVGAWWHHS